MNTSNGDFFLWALENKQWVDIYLDHGERQSVMDAILKASGQVRLTWKTVMANFIRHSGLEANTKTYNICRGHMAFTNWSDLCNHSANMDPDTCSVCLSPMQQNPAQGIDKFYYIPLRPRLERMFLNEESCRELYSYEMNYEQGHWHDFYDGKCFQRICEQYGGYDQIKDDIFIAISTDGFQPFRNTEQEVWPILAIILNLRPAIRYKIANILPIGFAPGPSPSNLQSFLAPLLHELRDNMGFEGSPFQFYDGVFRSIRVHVVWVLGDLPVVAKLASTQGHNGRKPCRFCNVTGVWSPSNRHYYYPSKLREENGTLTEKYNLCQPPIRTENEIQSCFDLLQHASGSDLQTLQTETGIKGRSILFSLPTLVPFRSFPIDTMHLLYNVSKEMLLLFIVGFKDDGLISKAQLDFIDESLHSFGNGISSSIAPRPSRLSKFRSWKAAEHKQFVLNYSLIVFENMIPNIYIDGWYKFVLFYDLVSRKMLTPIEVEQIGSLAVEFVNFVEEVMYRYEFSRVSICKYVFHLLLHVKDNILENGALVCFSQFWVERYIGSLVARLNAKRLPSTAIYRASLFSEAAKSVYDTPFQGGNQKPDGFYLLGAFEILMIGNVHVNRAFKTALKYYFARKHEGITNEECVAVMNAISEIHSYSRFCLRYEEYEMLFRCSGNRKDFSLIRPEEQWDAYVAVHMNESASSADLYYGRIRNIVQLHLDTSLLQELDISDNIQQLYNLIVVDWALNLEVGSNEQIRASRARSALFTQMSVEDITIVRRKIGIVETNIPTRFSGRRNKGVLRSRRVCSIIDEKVREDYVLSDTATNAIGKNIVLHLNFP